MPGQRYVDDYDYFLRRNKGRSPRKTKFNEKMPLKRRKRRPSRGCDHDYFCRVYFMVSQNDKTVGKSMRESVVVVVEVESRNEDS